LAETVDGRHTYTARRKGRSDGKPIQKSTHIGKHKIGDKLENANTYFRQDFEETETSKLENISQQTSTTDTTVRATGAFFAVQQETTSPSRFGTFEKQQATVTEYKETIGTGNASFIVKKDTPSGTHSYDVGSHGVEFKVTDTDSFDVTKYEAVAGSQLRNRSAKALPSSVKKESVRQDLVVIDKNHTTHNEKQVQSDYIKRTVIGYQIDVIKSSQSHLLRDGCLCDSQLDEEFEIRTFEEGFEVDVKSSSNRVSMLFWCVVMFSNVAS
jgi:hypothetical protein